MFKFCFNYIVHVPRDPWNRSKDVFYFNFVVCFILFHFSVIVVLYVIYQIQVGVLELICKYRQAG